MSASLSHGSNAEPNLTPILDMVFQLITFFMLVINFKSAAMDLNLKLPVVGSARPVEGKAQDLIVLNIDSKGQLTVYNVPQPDIDAYILREARVNLEHAKVNNSALKLGDELPTTVVIRADQATPFRLLNRVIKACQDNGFRNFSLKALNKAA